MVTFFIEEEEGAEEEVEQEDSGWVRGHLREIQLEDLGEVLLKDLEGEMEEDSIPKALWNEMREIGMKRNGQVLQVMGQKEEIFPSPLLQFKEHTKGLLPLTPSEDRLFTDWSSVRTGSPIARMPP